MPASSSAISSLPPAQAPRRPAGIPEVDPDDRDNLPWVAPLSDPRKLQQKIGLPTSARHKPLRPLPDVPQTKRNHRAQPPLLTRSHSHPARAALPYALPPGSPGGLAAGNALKHTLGPPGGVAALPDRRALIANILERLPLGLWPILGALSGIWRNAKQLGYAWTWQRMLRRRTAQCQGEAGAVAQQLTSLRPRQAVVSPHNQRHAKDLLASALQSLRRERAALRQALVETLFRLVSTAVELWGLVSTLLPQVHGLLRLSLGAAWMTLVRASFVWCLLAHGLLGVVHSAGHLVVLYRRRPLPPVRCALQPSKAALWLDHCRTLHEEAVWYHLSHMLLCSGFTASLSMLLYVPLLPWALAVCTASLLGLTITALAWQHLIVAERFDAPRALWLSLPWNHLAFAGPKQLSMGYNVLCKQQQRLQRSLVAVTADLPYLRRRVLRGLFTWTSVPLFQHLFEACSRLWLYHQQEQVWQWVQHVEFQYSRAVGTLWAEQAMALKVHAGNHILMQNTAADFVSAATQRRELIHVLTQCRNPQVWRLVLAKTHALGAAAALKHGGVSLLLAQKTQNDQLRVAFAWAGRWQLQA